VILLPALLLAAEAPESVEPPLITIDCVEVDAQEVRRLTVMELRSWRWRTSPETFEVLAVCQEGVEELRLTHRTLGQVTVRSIDLSAPEAEAKARELALAIAELLRRADMEAAPEKPPMPPPPPVSTTAPHRNATSIAPTPERASFGVEVGATGVVSSWTGGELLFGADAIGRVHLGPRVIAELRLGGRKTQRVDLENGSLDAQGVTLALGVAFDATPDARHAGVSFGARLGGDFLRYAAVDRDEVLYGGGDATAVSLSGTTTGWVALSKAFRLTIDASVGGALHSVVVRVDEQSVSAMHGAVLAGSLGLAAHF
jgi:hypothetical protein